MKNVGPIRHNEPPHAHSPDVASGTIARRLRIDVLDDNDNDNAWQRGPLWPHGMGPKKEITEGKIYSPSGNFAERAKLRLKYNRSTHPSIEYKTWLVNADASVVRQVTSLALAAYTCNVHLSQFNTTQLAHNVQQFTETYPQLTAARSATFCLFSARCNIYISRLYATMSVSVCLSACREEGRFILHYACHC